jgi:hypothetical protein
MHINECVSYNLEWRGGGLIWDSKNALLFFVGGGISLSSHPCSRLAEHMYLSHKQDHHNIAINSGTACITNQKKKLMYMLYI